MSEFNNWFGVRFPNIQATMDQTNDQESKLLKLCCKEVWQSKQAEIDSLKTQLVVYKEDMQKDAEKIGELQKRVNGALEELEFPTASWEETVYTAIQALKGGAIQCRHIFQEATAWGDKARTLVCQKCPFQKEVPFYALDVELEQQTNRGDSK